MNFISKNRYVLFVILGVVSMALMISNITKLINDFQYYIENGIELTTRMIFLLVEYICIFFAELVFVIIGYRRQMDKYLILTSVILYYASTGAMYVYEVFFRNDFSYILNLAISVLCIVTVFISLTNPRYFLSSLILLLIDSAFCLSNTFAGSTVGLSTLILTILLIFSVVLYNDRRVDDNDYNAYS